MTALSDTVCYAGDRDLYAYKFQEKYYDFIATFLPIRNQTGIAPATQSCFKSKTFAPADAFCYFVQHETRGFD